MSCKDDVDLEGKAVTATSDLHLRQLYSPVKRCQAISYIVNICLVLNGATGAVMARSS